jgi:hypothetical protein
VLGRGIVDALEHPDQAADTMHVEVEENLDGRRP